MKLTLTIPLKVTYTLNSRLHWSQRAKMRKAERGAVVLAFATCGMRPRPPQPHWRWNIALTRVGPREMDDDNVAGALKAIRDEIAKQLGVDDRDKRVTWTYHQVKGPYAVRIAIDTSVVRAA